MDINAEAKRWSESNGDKTLEQAFVAGFTYYGQFLESVNLKKEAKIKKKQDDFYNLLKPFLGEHTKETLRAFYDYWSEADFRAGKLRWEKEKTWELSKRLSRWIANNDSKPSYNSTNKQKDEVPVKKYREIS